jgi:hypothetical protein
VTLSVVSLDEGVLLGEVVQTLLELGHGAVGLAVLGDVGEEGGLDLGSVRYPSKPLTQAIRVRHCLVRQL